MAYTILGGRLSGPVDLSIKGDLPVTLAAVTQNIETAMARNLPGIPRLSCVGRRLVVIGGGPSINGHVDEILALAADPLVDIWAVNGAWLWCHGHGIVATFFAIDPHPIVLNWLAAKDGTKPKRAIVSVCCDARVFDELAGADIIALAQGREELRSGSSTAGMAPHVAALMGYGALTFYGCESSYPMGMSHAYMHEPRDEELIIVADGAEHLTAPDYMMQAKEMAAFIHAIPEFLSEKSGGLLCALINDLRAGREMHIKWISQGMLGGLKNMRPCGVPATTATQRFDLDGSPVGSDVIETAAPQQQAAE